MIKSKEELRYYLACDRIALGEKRIKPRFIGDEIWKYQRLMRRLDYATTIRRKLLGGGRYALILRLRYRRLAMKLGFSIPFDVIGPGLALVHYGTVVISTHARLGANCKIHTGVNIGATSGGNEAASIGDNVYIGPGAKIIGNVRVGDNACIGANAVVVTDVEAGVTVGGIPAKKISDNDSEKHLIRATELVQSASTGGYRRGI